MRDNDYVAGQFLWTGIDYLGEANRWPNRGSSAGLLDVCGFKKPNGLVPPESVERQTHGLPLCQRRAEAGADDPRHAGRGTLELARRLRT